MVVSKDSAKSTVDDDALPRTSGHSGSVVVCVSMVRWMFFWPCGSGQSLIVQMPVDDDFSARLDNETRPDAVKHVFS